MAFVLLLLLSITTLTRVSTLNSNQTKHMQLAQANALLGLNIALGELQKHAGPDQRITARAEILDADPVSPQVDGVTQPYWTAVWPTGAAGLDIAESGSPQREISLGSTTPTLEDKSASATWLVSNPDPATLPNPGTWSAVYPSAVTLAKDLGVDARDVEVPLVDVEGGRYGYWVSDEGVKAKVNLIDPTFNSGDAALSQLHQWSPHALPLQTILPMKTPGDFRTTPSTEVSKVTDNASLGLLTMIDPTLTLNTYSPDITTYSYGVLSDVRHGGLKKDLTAALEDADNFNTFADTYGNGDRSIYRSGLDLPNDGPLWYSLFYYYNTYKSVMPTPPGLSADANNAPTSSINIASPPYTLTPRGYKINYPSSATPTWLNGPLPVVIAYRVDIAVGSFFDDNDGNWKLRLQFYPQLVLCNPYSARLSFSGFTIGKSLDVFRGTTLNITIGGVTTSKVLDMGRFTLQPAGGEVNTLDPGETRVFALAADLKAGSIATAGSYSALKSAANPAVSADHYQYFDFTETALATTDGDAMVKLTLTNNIFSNHNPTTNRVIVTYMHESVNPMILNWPLKANAVGYHNRYGVVANEAFTSPAVPNVWIDQTISNLATPRRVLGFFARRKGLAGSNSPDSYTNGAQGVPIFMGNSSVLTPFAQESSTQWMEVFLSPFGSSYLTDSTVIDTSPTGETTWGDRSVGDDASGSLRRYILRDIPSQPLVSIGQFMHMPTYRFTDGTNYNNHLMSGSMFTGGSLIPVNVATDTLTRTHNWSGGGNTRLYLDDSFLANEALFDRFFFSTVPPATLSNADNPPTYWTQFNADNGGPRLVDSSTPFLNTRIKPYYREGIAPAMADLRDPEKAAAKLMLEGAFNINSTSIPAWRALLSSLSGNRLGIWNATGRTMATLDGTALQDTNPIPRFWSASSTGTPNAPWDGLRVLTDDQVNDLAEQIVAQVKTRGPFLSMADFLNRRLGSSSSALTRAGALQAAIDNTSPDINQAAKALGTDVTMTGGKPEVIPANLRDATGATLNTAVGIPGYLMQQDLVQAFSPVMTARSDTFVIRSYGEAVNPATEETTKAWIEAVVQRTPEYIDQADSKLSAVGDATPAYQSDGNPNVGPTNLQFGRNFRIIQSRWLTSDEL